MILDKASKNANYTSPSIQHEILKIIVYLVRSKIRDEVGDAKFCFLADEAIDESNSSKMAIVLRYVDCDVFVRERFLKLLLQLTLVVAAKEVLDVWLLFSKLSSIVNFVGSSSKRHSQLKSIREDDFIFILLLMHRVLETSDMLCHALQRKNQDILNAMSLVTTSKLLFQKMRDDEWEDFLWSVNNFCDSHDIVVPDLTDRYVEGTKRSCQQKNHFTVEEYYHFHVFNVVIDKKLMKLNTHFTEQSIELLTLYEALNPSDGFKSFSDSAIYSLIDKFYPNDFSKDNMKYLKTQLDHYKLDVFEDPKFKDVDSLPKLCRLLVETKKSRI
ncbi:uncharacterized protein [Primulina huaijiensis]|uniref:uncharacterized protein n=1 Tax=Primulina huaijiensis TaxID=1492673 RepID=UPI003CC6DF95